MQQKIKIKFIEDNTNLNKDFVMGSVFEVFTEHENNYIIFHDNVYYGPFKSNCIIENKEYSNKEIIELWRNMEDIPTDENSEVIESDYFIWKKGTLVSEIWSWFNKNYSKGLKELWLDA
ncbi:hypothetical protein FDA48_05660 [Clostridium botulinum]|nr:hypothetical protein [Clostridium botulinum]